MARRKREEKYYIIQSNYLASGGGKLFCSVTESETKAILLLFHYLRRTWIGSDLRQKKRSVVIQMLRVCHSENQQLAQIFSTDFPFPRANLAAIFITSV